MRYRVGSFNVKNLSLGGKRDLDRIAHIILDNKLDIVAMQEVLSEGKILTGINGKSSAGAAKAYEYSLKRRLGQNWRICWQDPRTSAKNYPFLGVDSRQEGYAFLWNTDKFSLPKDENGNDIYPRIWRNYKTNVEEGMIRLIREPCVGRFIAKGRKVEIRLITTHIVYGKPKAENLSVDLDFGAVKMRQNEFKILAGQIYPRVSQYAKDVNCVAPYTIILGDYNMNLKESGLATAIVPSIACFDDRGHMLEENESGSLVIKTVQKDLSTLKRDSDGLANNYDHFSYEMSLEEKHIVGSANVINAIGQGDSSGSFDKYREDVSDHLPVVIEVNV